MVKLLTDSGDFWLSHFAEFVCFLHALVFFFFNPDVLTHNEPRRPLMLKAPTWVLCLMVCLQGVSPQL